MTMLATAWWLFFFTALGLCIGSFLNVVVYRLPLDQSLRVPLWSACPYCRARIAWYDNVPVLSFVLLGGRCRHCHAPISTRYLVVEAGMALVVLMLLDAFFVGQVRGGLSPGFGLTDRLTYNWPVFLAHIVLFACLMSMSIIDLEHYWVDIRFTHLASAAGFVLHTIWTPRDTGWVRPSSTMAFVSIMVLIGLTITWLVSVLQPEAEPDADESDDEPADVAEPVRRPRAPLRPPPRLAGWTTTVLLLALFAGLLLFETGYIETLRHAPRALLPVVLLFLLIVSESTVDRQSDKEIMDVIEEERGGARRMVLGEFGMLLPSLCFGIAGFCLIKWLPALGQHVEASLEQGVRVDGLALMRDWSPFRGLATAATGYVVAGSLGWAVRIFFTLAFGKEAFGAGDIHLMAAAGCIAGWPVVVIGFFLTCGLALVGWAVTLLFKRTRVLPLGPWLSLSFLIVVVFYDDILELPVLARTIDAARMLFLHNSQQVIGAGVG